MDSDLDSVFDDYGNESEGFVPEVKSKKAAPKKAAAAKPAAKKAAAPKKPAAKKRPKPESDDDDDSVLGGSMLSNTPPSAKKQKKAPAAKKSSGKPLAEIENESMLIDSPVPAKSKAGGKSATETYQKLTQLEHILKRPDTYIGSVERTEQQMWVFSKESKLVVKRPVSFVPGLYKIFDEILVNAADNKQRDPEGMTYLKVKINRETGEIMVENNGKGIPVEMHEKEKVYIPEMVFGHLLAGSNFDDDEKKTVGGRNGYGAKLCNVFSTEFHLEVQDSSNGKRYKQTWTNNMTKMEKAKVTSNKTQDFVRVTFKPDYAKFGMPDGIDDDLEALLTRRVYDMAGTVRAVKVYLNDELLKIDFKKYCSMYAKAIAKERDDAILGDDGEPMPASVIFETATERWQVAFTVSDGSFQQVSFVNSIATTSGGTHVNYIADQIVQALLKDLNKRAKGHSLKANHIRNHIFIFVSALVNNPTFNSQTKEQLTSKPSSFGKKCELTDSFLKRVRATDAINNIMHFAEKKADKLMAKSDGSRRSRISNEKLIDANLAGTKRGHECTLILTEGDSARGLAVAGRAILDPDKIGVFPLRGKMLNVRDASTEQIANNKEIQFIKQILGLKHKTVYTDTKALRYGHLMIMADQDHDGSHIKGLLINWLQVQYPSLLKIPDFFREFITPVVKVWQGSNPKKPLRLKSFYSMPQYEEWKEQHKHEIKKWETKYYKGLGTSTNEDAQVYFTNLDDHLKEFSTMKTEEVELFELAFSKKKADARKEWLGGFVPGTFLDQSTKQITYSDFVHKELILFSMADNLRSIPSMVDGLKPGQRKVMYACFKMNLVKDQKVVELAGYVSRHTAYHHGETSLQQTIVGLAQNYVGSNNINVLEPSGNFGSRLQGGSDAASARYIHTRLSPLARRIYSALDEPVLDHQFEDGKLIEPRVYVPVIPMILVNGASGIGTGWSTDIPNFHPMDIVKNLRRRMGRLDPDDQEEKPFVPMAPWFRGWKGVVEPDGPKFKFNGIATAEEAHNEVTITELPIRMWTDDFKAKLEEIIRAEKTPSWIKDYKEFNDHKTVHFVIQLEEKHMNAAMSEGLLEKFKLNKSIGITNLVAFDTQGKIRKYDSPDQIMEEYFHYRMALYTTRKAHWLKVFHAAYRKLQNQYRFIHEVIEGKMIVSKKKKAVLVEELRARKYEAFPKEDRKAKVDDDEELAVVDHSLDVDESTGSASDYDYLLSMPLWSLTYERLERLEAAIKAKKKEHDELEALSEKDLWCRDLDAFVEEWENQIKLDQEIQTNIRRMGRRVSKKIGAGTGKTGTRRVKDEEDYEPAVKKTKAAPKPKVVEQKTHQRFAEMFGAKPKPKPKAASKFVDGPADDDNDDFSDDDFASLGKVKKAIEPAPAPAESTTTGRSKRAAASVAATKAKTYLLSDDDDLSDDDFAALGKASAASSAPKVSVSASQSAVEDEDEDIVMTDAPPKRAAAAKAKPILLESDSEDNTMEDNIGDIGSLVKGVDAKTTDNSKGGRLSLFAMSQAAGASSGLPKLKSKPSRTFDFDSQDDTNYEALAMSSPHKSTKGGDLDDFLSDDDDLPHVSKLAGKSKAAAAPVAAAAPAPVKKRGRPAKSHSPSEEPTVAAPKPKPNAKAKRAPAAPKAAPAPKSAAARSAAAPKASDLSPAAKAYAKKRKTATVLSDDEDLDMDDGDNDDDTVEPIARPAARARPGRAAAAKKPIVLDDSLLDDEDESDEFAMDDSE
ncbi:DNA topoisomerase [Coniochaeta sp. 2T2.1]|nr:DNA topoisomerase [Coniochaeta sp. 2T2.1]